MVKRIRKINGYHVIGLIALILYSIFFVFPALYSLFYSFTDWNGISPGFQFVGIKNYQEVFQNSRLLNSIKITLLYTVISVGITIPVSIIMAMLLNTKIKFQNGFRFIYFYPALLAMLVVGLIWNEIFANALPALGETLGISFLKNNLTASADTAFLSIIIRIYLAESAMPTVLFIACLQSIPADLYDAAKMDGASPLQRFWAVTFPYLIPTLIINLIKCIRDSLVVFDYIFAITDGGPARATESMGYLIYKMGTFELSFSKACSIAEVLFVIILIVSFVIMKGLNRKGVDAA